jgi:hypothetical protein
MALRKITFAIAFSINFAAACPAFAALTESEVEALVKSEKTWTNRSGLTLKINQNELTIGTYRQAGATDKDMKIDSVMITRKIMEADPGLARVKIRFYDPVNRRNYELIDVRQSDIKAFSEGLIDIETLLTGIDLKKVSEAAEVTDGPFASERLQAKQHIERLRTEGVGVAVFVQLFSQAEDLAGKINKEPVGAEVEKNKTELRALLDRLSKAFDDQAAFVKQQKEKAFAKQLEILNKSRSTAPSAPVAAAGKAATKPKWEPPPADVDPKTGLERLGRFTPIPGPFLIDRIYIARKMTQLEKNNSPVTNLLPTWQRLEIAARKHDDTAMKNDLEYLQKQLGLPTLSEQDREVVNVIKSPRP